MPFANLSDQTSQAYFSDGMTEEILTLLAKQPNLRVVSRTTVQWFDHSPARLAPNDPSALYNVTCAFANAGLYDEALDLLERRVGKIGVGVKCQITYSGTLLRPHP
ncbi:MAG: hypothetical protein ACSLE2_09455 [Lysobacterales bacterium]